MKRQSEQAHYAVFTDTASKEERWAHEGALNAAYQRSRQYVQPLNYGDTWTETWTVRA